MFVLQLTIFTFCYYIQLVHISEKNVVLLFYTYLRVLVLTLTHKRCFHFIYGKEPDGDLGEFKVILKQRI